MLKFLLYCDLPTMNCTAQDINQELSEFADSYVQVNDGLWFFKYPDTYTGSFLAKGEQLFYDHFEKFTDDSSIMFLSKFDLDDCHYRILPDAVDRFLDSDSAQL